MKSPIAIKTLTNCAAIQILEIDEAEDRVCYRLVVVDSKPKRASWSALHWDRNGEPWFTAYGCREYLRDYVRV